MTPKGLRCRVMKDLVRPTVFLAMAMLLGACSRSDTNIESLTTSSPHPSTTAGEPIGDKQVEAATLQLKVTECATGLTNRASAVVIDNNSIVSVAHTLEGAGTPTLLDSSGREVSATLTYLDSERDLVVFRLKPGMISGLPLSPEGSDRSVRYVSFAEDDGPEIREATILRYTRLTLDGVGDRAGIELRAPIAKGDSGGPVLDDNGAVLGVVFAANNGTDSGWAIASEEIRTAIEASVQGDLPMLKC